MFWGEKRRGVFKIKAWEYVLVQSYLTEGESEGNSVFGTVLYSYSSEFAEARDHSIEVRPFSNWNNNNKTERLRKPSYEENETNKFRERERESEPRKALSSLEAMWLKRDWGFGISIETWFERNGEEEEENEELGFWFEFWKGKKWEI